MKKKVAERFQQKQIDETKPLHELSPGERLRVLREQAGLGQGQVADLLGLTSRQVSYYEIECPYPLIFQLLPKLCELYGVTTDEFFGVKPVPERNYTTLESQLLTAFHRFKKLPAYKKRALMQVIETFLELDTLKKEMGLPTESPKTRRSIKKRS